MCQRFLQFSRVVFLSLLVLSIGIYTPVIQFPIRHSVPSPGFLRKLTWGRGRLAASGAMLSPCWMPTVYGMHHSSFPTLSFTNMPLYILLITLSTTSFGTPYRLSTLKSGSRCRKLLQGQQTESMLVDCGISWLRGRIVLACII